MKCDYLTHRKIREVNRDCGQAETSSDEDDDDIYLGLNKNSHRSITKLQLTPEPAEKATVLDTFAPKPAQTSGESTSSIYPVIFIYLNLFKV